MAYWKPGIWNTLVGRLTGDSGTGGLITSGLLNGSRVYVNKAPPSVTLASPYVTLNIVSATLDDTFSTGGRSVICDVHLWVAANVSGQDGNNRRSLCMERIHGDWAAQAQGTNPTYGLHRWTPGQIATTGWYVTAVLLVNEADVSTIDTYHDVYTVRFGVYQNRT